MTTVPEVLVLASGSATGGGSGFEKLIEHQAGSNSVRPYKVAGVVSNHQHGGVREKADRLGVPFYLWNVSDAKRTADALHELVGQKYPVMMSGWLKLVRGFELGMAINIHPGPTTEHFSKRPFAGPGMYGHHVHEAVHAAFQAGKLAHTEVTIHLVTDEYDAGAVIARIPVPLYDEDTPDTIATRVNAVEHQWQWQIMSAWLRNFVLWDKQGRVTTSPFPR